MNKYIEILVVTRSVVLQQGLGALLESLPGITGTKAIRELESAYIWIEAHQPRIAFIDSDISKNSHKTTLEEIQKLSPTTQRVLLVDDVEEVDLMPKYADAILIKGMLPSAVASIVADLLSTKEDDHDGVAFS
jgi:DNA-binding NarL/FixJ family response regulator